MLKTLKNLILKNLKNLILLGNQIYNLQIFLIFQDCLTVTYVTVRLQI